MKRSWSVVIVDVVIALGLGLMIWLSERGQPKYVETKASR